MDNLDAIRKYVTTLDDFKRWLNTNKARMFRGHEVMIDTDEMIRVKNKRIGMIIDLIFKGDDILVVHIWDEDLLADGTYPSDYQDYEVFELFKAGETDYAFLASNYQFSLSL